MALIRFSSNVDPLGGLLALQNELERFFRNPDFGLGLSGTGAFPPINIFNDQDGAVIIAEVPGLDPSAVSITVQGHTITLSGERKREEVGDASGYHRRERAFGDFSRSIQLPEDLDTGRAAASYDSGLLVVRVPKAEHAKPRQITINAR